MKLTERARALARAEHDDLSVGDECADRIEALEAALRDILKWSELHHVEIVHALTGSAVDQSPSRNFDESLGRARKLLEEE